VLVCSGLVLAITAFLPFVVGLDFFPVVDAGQMRLHYRAPIGTRLEDTERLVARLEQRIQDIVPVDELETINSNIGWRSRSTTRSSRPTTPAARTRHPDRAETEARAHR